MSGNKISDHMKARNNICKALDWKWEKREREICRKKSSQSCLRNKRKERVGVEMQKKWRGNVVINVGLWVMWYVCAVEFGDNSLSRRLDHVIPLLVALLHFCSSNDWRAAKRNRRPRPHEMGMIEDELTTMADNWAAFWDYDSRVGGDEEE